MSSSRPPSSPTTEAGRQDRKERLVNQSRAFRSVRTFDYLAEDDRYLTQRPSPEFSFAIIGCGMMGTEHMRNALLEGSGRIQGLYDPSPRSIEVAKKILARAAGEKAAQEVRVYDSIDQACADPEIDAVFICTPNHTHLDLMRVAARYDKAIFLEKPIATSVEDADEVCRLAANHSKLVQFGLQYRYKAIYAEAIEEALQRGSLGRLHQVSIAEHRFPFLDKVDQWNKFNANTGGTLIEKCCHYFDLLNLFAGGAPTRVFASGHQAVNFLDFEKDGLRADGLDHAQVIIDYDNDAVGAFSLCMFAPGSSEDLVLCGDHGRLHASEKSVLGAANENRIDIWVGENGAARTITPAYPPYIEAAGHHGSTFFEHVAFMDALRTGNGSGATIEGGFWSVVVGAAAQRSIERREAVSIEEILPRGFTGAFTGNSAGD